MMKRSILTKAAAVGLGAVAAAGLFGLVERNPATAANDAIQHGRYLVEIGGCNDCHTPGYLAKEGEVPEGKWLIGDSVGFTGPWGTTYPANLRSFVRQLDEEGWIKFARKTKTRPPMPWFNFRKFTDNDLRAMYRYIQSLPADETQVPEYVPPDQQPKTPHIVMVPQSPKQ
jgi:mono/diheme cytochrome c family protein